MFYNKTGNDHEHCHSCYNIFKPYRYKEFLMFALYCMSMSCGKGESEELIAHSSRWRSVNARSEMTGLLNISTLLRTPVSGWLTRSCKCFHTVYWVDDGVRRVTLCTLAGSADLCLHHRPLCGEHAEIASLREHSDFKKRLFEILPN